MSLLIYNTLSHKREKFKPLQRGFMGIYLCGPTVYSHAHIGHAKSAITFDVIVRYFRYLGYKVRYVRNITDVGHLTETESGEDKIIKGAKLAKLEPMELVEIYMKSYLDNMDALNVLRPNIAPRASAHIIEQIEMIKRLIKSGHAYESNGSVYFDVSSYSDYGKLSGRTVEEQEPGARVEINPDKKNPADFALWRKAEPGHILRWPSPWGEGYPGWHMECSAMSIKYLGQPFDIHGGGVDLQFPHHECEIAQAVCANNLPFARFWIHHGMITVDGLKMSKSLGNFVTINEMLSKHESMSLRFLILSTHYRSNLDFNEKALRAASQGINRLYEQILSIKLGLSKVRPTGNKINEQLSEKLKKVNKYFLREIDNDFNTPGALSVIFEFINENKKLFDGKMKLNYASLRALDELFEELLGEILGLIPEDLVKKSEEFKKQHQIFKSLINIVLKMRGEYRKKREWEKADKIRRQLARIGISLEDTKKTSKWRSSPVP